MRKKRDLVGSLGPKSPASYQIDVCEVKFASMSARVIVNSDVG